MVARDGIEPTPLPFSGLDSTMLVLGLPLPTTTIWASDSNPCSAFKFPVRALKFPDTVEKIPDIFGLERSESPNRPVNTGKSQDQSNGGRENSLYFSLLTGICPTERFVAGCIHRHLPVPFIARRKLYATTPSPTILWKAKPWRDWAEL
jgi:hypothetical protein